MKFNNNIDSAYESLHAHSDSAQVILLHPNSQYRSLIVAKLVQDPNVKTFYYALGDDDVNLQSFLEGFAHEMTNQHPTFGRHLYMLPQELYRNFEADLDRVLDTFVAEISELSDTPFLLILDEYDRSDDSSRINRFVELLTNRLPEHCKLLLNGRTLPRLPWMSFIAKRQAVILRDEQLVEKDFYGPHEHDTYQLQVYGLGPGFVSLDNENIDNWEGHLPRLLFFFALDRPIVTRAEICDAFWPDLDMDQAVNVFHVTKRRLHKALDRDVLLHTENYYQVNPELTIYYDIIEFVEALMEGRNPNTADRFEAYKRAADLYRGPFLQGHDEQWIVERREAMRAGYLEALTEMARTWIQRDRGELALRLYRQAIEEDYLRQDIHRELMLLYNQLGRRSEAVAHYQQLEKQLTEQKRELEPETKQTYAEIMA